MSILLAKIFYILTFPILIALAWRDVKEYILPNILNAALAFCFMCFHMADGWVQLSPVEALIGAAAGGGLLLGIKIIADKLYQQDSLGLGDVKLMAAAGLGLGFPNIMLATSLGAFLGILHGALIGFLHKRRTGKDLSFSAINVPAGLGLTLGIAIVFAVRFKIF